jgi:hypothetical protein
VPVCPIPLDIHSIVEHMAGTLKGWVLQKLPAMDLDSDDLLFAPCQGLIWKAVAGFGTM